MPKVKRNNKPKRKRVIDKYKQWYSGKPYNHHIAQPLYIACCHCNLTHKFTFKIKSDKVIEITAYSDDKETKVLRALNKKIKQCVILD